MNPTDKGGHALNIIKIASAYGKDVNVQGFIDNSRIRYTEPNKKRINSWLSVNRLKLPLPSSSIDSLNTTVPQKSQGVNTSISENAENDTGKAKYSLSDDYDGMVEKYGAIKPEEKPARDIKVPKQTNDDTKVRQYAYEKQRYCSYV